jgi:hypothetical protein
MGEHSRDRWIVALCVAVAITIAGCADDASEGVATDRGNDDATTTVAPPSVPSKYAGYRSTVYADPASWVCRPDATDICDGGLDATVVAADGITTVEPWTAAEDPPIDCFYVYPTISRDPGGNSDMVASDREEGYAALNQVARLGSECRVFAPTYRQGTLGSLTSRITGVGGEQPDPDMAYGDVVDAWKHYMANDNQGRGVVLVGHSQGSALLTRLIAGEIDGDDEVRSHLVSAFLAGSSVAVPEGEDVGGAFQQVPLCRAEDQTGCVVSWASFRSTAPPPPNTFFGKVRGDAGQGPDAQVAACVNPASLKGGSADLHSYLPASPDASILAALGTDARADARSWSTTMAITTPFASLPGLVSGECVSRDGINYLEVTVHDDPADARADDIGGDLTPEWGLHLVDVNLVMGDIVDLVHTQAAAYADD